MFSRRAIIADTLHSLPGNAANNKPVKPVVLKGTPNNDVLHGSLGHTTFYGGLGNDIYHSKNAGDTIVEYADEGNNTVYANTTFTLPTHVENLTLEGNGNTFGFGNNSNNILTGNSGNNRLSGGRGDDVYHVDNVNDTVTERWGEGTDIYSSVSYTAPENVENLTLRGSSDINGIGNRSDNILTGNNGNNRLSGEDGNDFLYSMGGNDTLSGGNGNDHLNGGDSDDYLAGGLGSDTIVTGAGRDTAAFTAADIREGSIDRLLDFNPQMDKLDLSGMRSLLSGSNANLSWSEMLVDKDPETVLKMTVLILSSIQSSRLLLIVRQVQAVAPFLPNSIATAHQDGWRHPISSAKDPQKRTDHLKRICFLNSKAKI